MTSIKLFEEKNVRSVYTNKKKNGISLLLM